MTDIVIPADIHLSADAHEPNDNGEYCIVEAWCYLRGLPWSDRPDCMSPVIGEFLRIWNDDLSDEDRDRLLVPLLAREFPVGSPEVEERRALLAMDWLVRVHVPAFLRLVPSLVAHADALAGLPPIDDWTALDETVAAVRTARVAAPAAVRDARAAGVAWATAYEAAAHAAAGDAAASSAAGAVAVAWYLTGAAIRADTRAAAEAAAEAAGKTAVTPVVAEMQQSALDLIDRMEAAR